MKTNDPRSSYARALDLAAEWLAERLPDRIPAGAPLLALVNASWLSSMATELGRRLHNRFRNMPEYAHATHGRPYQQEGHASLKDRLDRLPKLLREPSLTDGEIRGFLDHLGSWIHDIENPVPPAAAPAHWAALAADLRIELGDDVEGPGGAERQLAAVLRDRDFGDRRTAPLWQSFAAFAMSRAAPTREARLLRRILVGHGVPAVRATDRLWALDKTEARYVARPMPKGVKVAFGIGGAPAWLELIFREVGADRAEGLATSDSDTDINARIAKDLEVLQRRRRHGELTDQAFEDGRRELDLAAGRARAALANRYTGTVEALRESIVVALDGVLERQELGPAWWWAREARRHLALDPADPGLAQTGIISAPALGGNRLLAWSVFRSYEIPLGIEPVHVNDRSPS